MAYAQIILRIGEVKMLDILPTNEDIMPWVTLLIAGFGIFIWRFLGLTLSSKIKKDGLFAKWINAVAFAMTTGLMVRIVFYPTGALSETAMLDRLVPFIIGVTVYLFFPKKPIIGLLVGMTAFSSTIFYRVIY